MWNQEAEEEILNDLEQSDPALPTDYQLDSASSQSRALSRWVLLFIMFFQTTYKLSNTVISVLLRFFRVFLSVLGEFNTVASSVAQCLPSSLYMAGKLENELKFRIYVCRKCHKIYHMAECIEGHGSTQISKHCAFKAFPLHPHCSMRGSCGTLLLKTVELAGGRTYLYPFLSYCYVGLDQSLQLLLNRPDFVNRCEQWRSVRPRDGMLYYDVYDGHIWKEFQCYSDCLFLSEQLNFGLMMNMDFSQPFKHIQYSLGAIYIFNLPWSIRSKQENTILVYLIPGPHEPRHDINTFLEPFVTDLLWFLEWSRTQCCIFRM